MLSLHCLWHTRRQLNKPLNTLTIPSLTSTPFCHVPLDGCRPSCGHARAGRVGALRGRHEDCSPSSASHERTDLSAQGGSTHAVVDVTETPRPGAAHTGYGRRTTGLFTRSAAVSPLMAALQDDHAAVRKAAAEALGQLGDLRAVDSLVAALQDENHEVREGVAWEDDVRTGLG
ncbi:MAG: HEAT repeat domain-containing protein [Candidatus Entotheonellia bacterium]